MPWEITTYKTAKKGRRFMPFDGVVAKAVTDELNRNIVGAGL
jgi:hypothetical protein